MGVSPVKPVPKMDDLLAEGDFDDVAAAVGEGGDGSDDDARVRTDVKHTWYSSVQQQRYGRQ